MNLSFVERFRYNAATHPDRPVAMLGDRVLSWREALDHAERFHEILAASGCRRIIILCDKSVFFVPFMMAAASNHTPYVPLAEDTPPERLKAIADNCAETTCWTIAEDGSALEQHTVGGGATVRHSIVDAARKALRHEDPAEVGYILFTSGSTGVPKGIQIEFRNVHPFIVSALEDIRMSWGDHPDKVFLNYVPYTFDLSVLDLYGPIVTGGAVSMIEKKQRTSPAYCLDILQKHRVNVIYVTPSTLSLFCTSKLFRSEHLPDLDIIIGCGEIFGVRLAIKLRQRFPDRRILNWYGPAETNATTTYLLPDHIPDDQKAISIGVCFPHCSYAEELSPTEPREMVFESPTVARGYLNLPEKTAAAFSHEGGRRIYRTGDLGTIAPDGTVNFLGRRDFQVKIAGNRVELGEIEALFEKKFNLDEAIVIPVSRGDQVAKLSLLMFTKDGAGIDVADAKRVAEDHLADYMRPRDFILNPDRPVNSHGKTDRKVLIARYGVL